MFLIKSSLITMLILGFFLNCTTTWAQNTELEKSKNEYQVVVIGGGLAGLTAVNALAKKGITNVLILEQADRLGGKMWTERNQYDPTAPYYERGAELVNASDVELIELVHSLGLSLTERRFKRDMRNEILMFKERTLHIDGKISEGTLTPYTFKELAEKTQEFPQDVKILEAIQKLQDSRSALDKLESLRAKVMLKNLTAQSIVESGVYTKIIFEALIKSEFGVSLSQINADVLLDYVNVTKTQMAEGKIKYDFEIIPDADEKFRITNGTDSIISELEKKHQDKIQKNTQVEGVEQISPSEFKITVKKSKTTTASISSEIKAQHVVFAVPAYQLGKINLVSPDIAPKRIEHAAALPFGKNAKIFLIFKNKFWDDIFKKNTGAFSGVGLLESGVQFWDTTENQSQSKKGVLTLYPGEWPTEAEAQQQKLKQILSDLKKVPGLENLEQHLLKVDIQNWRKSYAGVFSPSYTKAPKLFAEKLATNIYFAGADKDNDIKGQISSSYGYMNGAVRTALRAVDNIIHNLARSKRHSNFGKISCSALIRKAG